MQDDRDTGQDTNPSGRGWLTAGAAALTAGTGIVSTLIANKANKERAKETREWQERMVAEERAYKDPSMEMERLRAAGINPHMAYMKGGGVTQATSGAPQTVTPQMQRMDMNPQLVEKMLQLKQLQLMDSNIGNIDQKTQNLKQDEVSKLMDNWSQSFQLNFKTPNGQPLIEVNGQRMTNQQAFKQWMQGEPMPSAIENMFANQIEKRANALSASNQSDIMAVKKYLAQTGVINTSDTSLSVGIMMAKDMGIDVQTQRGLILTMGLINKVAPLLMRKIHPQTGKTSRNFNTRSVRYDNKGQYSGHTETQKY